MAQGPCPSPAELHPGASCRSNGDPAPGHRRHPGLCSERQRSGHEAVPRWLNVLARPLPTCTHSHVHFLCTHAHTPTPCVHTHSPMHTPTPCAHTHIYSLCTRVHTQASAHAHRHMCSPLSQAHLHTLPGAWSSLGPVGSGQVALSVGTPGLCPLVLGVPLGALAANTIPLHCHSPLWSGSFAPAAPPPTLVTGPASAGPSTQHPPPPCLVSPRPAHHPGLGTFSSRQAAGAGPVGTGEGRAGLASRPAPAWLMEEASMDLIFR